MIDDIAEDRISDITTNVLREPLIRYTQDACRYYGIPLQQDVDSGPMWDPKTTRWYNQFVNLPIPDGKRLLLIPKYLVRRRLNYDVNEYYSQYLLESLRQEELSSLNSDLVKLVKSRNAWHVTKKSLIEKYGRGKRVIFEQTQRHPEALETYRQDKEKVSPALSHHDLAKDPARDIPKWKDLLKDLLTIAPGQTNATDYEHAVEKLLSALLYPALVNPKPQVEIHEGRKRVDIAYDNGARSGFFEWLQMHHPCMKIFVECKNYSGRVANPELDQLAGRFGPNRGKVGLLVCRKFDDKDGFLKRCRDTAHDDRGFIIPLDDDDLHTLLQNRQDMKHDIDFPLLRKRFDYLIV